MWFTTRKSGVNAINLKELLGFGSYGTAWNWLQKLRRCTIRQDREKLSGRVEVDEFVIGGQRSGKRGRGGDRSGPFMYVDPRNSQTWQRLRDFGHERHFQIQPVEPFRSDDSHLREKIGIYGKR